MWNSWADTAKQLADKAKAAAEKLDKQLNESVGVETHVAATVQKSTMDLDLNDDTWGDDDNLNDLSDAEEDDQAYQTPMAASSSQQNSQWGNEEMNANVSPAATEEGTVVQVQSTYGTASPQHLIILPDESSVKDDSISPQIHDSHEENQQDDLDKTETANDDIAAAPGETLVATTEIEVTDDVHPSITTEEVVDHPPKVVVDEADVPESALIETQFSVQEGDTDTDTPAVVDSAEAASEPDQLQEPMSESDQVEDPILEPENVDETTIEPEQLNEPIAESEQVNAPITNLEQVDELISISEQVESTITEPAFLNDKQPEQSSLQSSPNQVPVAAPSLADAEKIHRLLQQLQQVQSLLAQREEQLMNKTEQLTQIQAMNESEKDDLRQKIKDIKEEAKKRFTKAKERVEAAEQQLQTALASQASSDELSKQAAIISELREEGQNLAKKQATMEQAVRAAKTEARELQMTLEDERQAKTRALDKIAMLEAELKDTQNELAGARRGETLSVKLETDLQKVRQEDERKGSQILSLEQQLKEVKAEVRELLAELEDSRKGAGLEMQRTQKQLRKEHNDALSDIENKLNITIKEAGLREDALRHEVNEIRKRWQDAVRRADALSMDMIQSSTSPLLRQLESAERQSRARASAAAEIETKLREELEESYINTEKLARERSEYKTKLTRLERAAKESSDELKTTKALLEDKRERVKQLEDNIEKMEAERAKEQAKWAGIERLANEGVARVRSEMTLTVVESEERYRSQLESLQKELGQEREKRRQLEQQVSDLLDNAGMALSSPTMNQQIVVKEAKLKSTEGQANILAGALSGLGDDGNDSNDEADDNEDGHVHHNDNSHNSFAALEEMQNRFKAAKVELESLRQRLDETERVRDKLIEDLRDNNNAAEKLPLFEAKCRELTEENRQLSQEVDMLQEEMEEMRIIYRSQLESTLAMAAQEKSSTLNGSNGVAANDVEPDQLPVEPTNVESEGPADESKTW
jgi:hypothetical protein